VIIPNAELRKQFIATLDHLHIGMGNIAGNVASQAAYTYGDEWVDELMAYLSVNLDILEDYLQQQIPQIKMLRPEATFLVWLDCRELGMDDITLNKFFLEKARLGLNRGEMFGPGGSGFMRMNIGCTKATLNKALECLKEAFR
jgi:cystathionine beta-lyase